MSGEHKLTVALDDLKALFQLKGFSDFQGLLSLMGLSQKVTPSPSWVVSVHIRGFPHHQGGKPHPLTSWILCPRGKQRGQHQNPQFSCLWCSLNVRKLRAPRAPSKVCEHPNFPFLQALLPSLNPGEVLGKGTQHPGRVFGKSSSRRVKFLGVKDILTCPVPL